MIQPKLPSGNTALHQFLRELMRWIKSGRILESDTAKPDVLPTGTRINVKPGAEGILAMVFRGEYVKSDAYPAQSVVKISAGTYAGIYIATESVPANDPEPYLGGKWTLLGRMNEQGLFTG